MKAKTSQLIEALVGTLFFLFIIVPIFMIWIPRTILFSPYRIYIFDIGKIRFLGLFPIILGSAIYVACSGYFFFIGKSSPILFTQTKRLIVNGFTGMSEIRCILLAFWYWQEKPFCFNQ